MQADNKNNLDRPQEEQFEEKLLRSLKIHGFVFPDSEDEVEALYRNCLIGKLSLPEELKDSSWVFKFKEKKDARVIEFASSTQKEIVENLAQAAREGKEITKDVLSKMEADRKAAERTKE